MARRILLLLLALLLPLGGMAEGLSQEVEEAPEELGEFDLSGDPEPTPEPSPEAAPEQTPMPTLEPGSLNYPSDKVNFEGEIWTVLTRRWGLSDYQAAGLMSSLYLESSFCPYNAEGHPGVDNRKNYTFRAGDGVGFGLCQWTSPGRKAGLRRCAAAHGDENLVWDFDIQMEYMRGEINLTALKAIGTLYEVAEWATMRFERPNQVYENSWPGSRYEIARQIYRAHVGWDYEEPEMEFGIHGENGDSLADGLAFDGAATLTVRSNYYWRLKAPYWLDVQARHFYFPEEWEACACGYAGETELKLDLAALPLLREGSKLEFEIYTGSRVTRTVALTYTGETLPEVLIDTACRAMNIVSMIGGLSMDKLT